MDVSTLKAEIKAWERAFRAEHGRDPTTQEIKEQPDIADKYRLYRKLAKQTQQTRSAEPRTPPRGKPHAQSRPSTSASALLSTAQSKSRAVKTEGPVITSNPFSPVKNKAGKHRADNPGLAPLPIPALLSPSARANPFKTPTKSSSRPRVRSQIPPPALEEDPFPLIVRDETPQRGHLSDLIASTSSPTEHPPKEGNAVSRARKRLRGEAVSPSPVKRARVTTTIRTQPALAFIREDDEVSHQDSTNVGVHDTFIDDTPAKPPPGGKRFKVLFDESISVAQQASTVVSARPNQAQTSFSRTKSAGKGLFGFGFAPIKEVPERGLSQARSRAMSPDSSQSDEDMDWDALVPGPSQNRSSTKIKAPDFSPATRTGPKKIARSRLVVPNAVIPRGDNLFALAASDEADNASLAKKRSLSPDPPPSVSSGSRPVPSSLSLLPPSPPPPDANRKPKYLDKGKGRAFARKKVKLHGDADDESESESSETEVQVKEFPWSWTKHGRGRVPDVGSDHVEEPSADSDPEFDMAKYRRTASTSQLSDQVQEAPRETLEVNLPEDLRRVLALSPPKHTTTDPTDEDNLVRGLLYGRREGHYDALRGGEVWGVGEVSDEEEDELTTRKIKDEDEDDWEGEPVPWEVGEL